MTFQKPGGPSSSPAPRFVVHDNSHANKLLSNNR